MSNYIVDELQIRPDISSVKPESGLNVPRIDPSKLGQLNKQQIPSTAPGKLYDTNYFVDRTPSGDERKSSLRRGKDPAYWITPSVHTEMMKYRKRIDPFYSTRARVYNPSELENSIIKSLKPMIEGLSETINVRSLKDNYLDPADIDNVAYATYFNIFGKNTEIESRDGLLNDTWDLAKLNLETIKEDVMSNLDVIFIENVNYLEKESIIA